MKKEVLECKPEGCCKDFFSKKHHCSSGASNPIYGLGVVGALFYFLQGATSFSMVMMGISKAIFWPAVVLFKVLTYLKI